MRNSDTAPIITDGNSSDIFPFGEGTTGGNTNTDTGPIIATSTDTVIDLSGASESLIPRLRQLSTSPSAGIVAFDQASTTLVRFVDRATGHIYETKLDNSAITKISSVTIPKVYEAIWSSDGSRFLARYLRDDNETIRTFYAKIATTTRPEQALEGLFLDDGIREVTSVGTKIFSMNETSTGSQGILSNFDGSGRVSTFTSPFTGWLVTSANSTAVTLYSRPSGASLGSAYILDTKTGTYTKAGTDALGLIAHANADATKLIASSVSGNNISTTIQDLKKGTSAPVGISTLADKCTWSTKEKSVVYCAVPQSIPAGLYPDDWYKGKVSFNDGLWRIDTATGATDSVMTPELEAGVSMDIVNLSFDQAENALVFINKKDLTPWVFNLAE
ncbi:MAG TPA: hypothetical protein VIR98_02295 [Candidatus Paceibacterota bacterium]